MLKIKMAQLHEADVSNLSRYYENEVVTLKLELNTIRESNASDREKIYDLLGENDELRKNFEVEISKQKSKIQDLKVKFAAARMEFKEQITSLGTKMELTSMSLVRETEQKQKGAEFFEAEKRKFYKIIQDKDNEILSIHETLEHIKKIKEEELTQQQSQINMLRDSLIAKDQEFKEFKANLEQEF
jgi:N-methylhydantoinase A/oxoprolinase/acetone carboxylase beta subunit